MDHLEINELLTEHQHGFRGGRSCLTNLLETFEAWTESLDIGFDVDAIFLDYQKAFDTVPHRRLIHKMKAYGIRSSVVNWIEDFLRDREMRVAVHGSFSDWSAVDSGVPQGSVLGPLLFLIFVNDIPDVVNCPMKMFADDTKIWNTVQSEYDHENLQEDLNKLQSWSEKWLMKFNVEKCKVMYIGRTNQEKEYYMKKGNRNERLEGVDVEKDLGVWTSKDMKPRKQCIEAVKKANNVLRSINKTFMHINRDSFQILYKTYVCPHLELHTSLVTVL